MKSPIMHGFFMGASLFLGGVLASCGGGSANRPPIAVVASIADAYTGSTIHLDGSGSSDPDGALLIYSWRIVTKPAGSATTLQNPNGATPFLVPDLPGAYEVDLIVSDGELRSPEQRGTFVATIQNLAPVANAGTYRSVDLNTVVQLDGTGSTDPNGDALTYNWQLTGKPAASQATLMASNTARPTLTVDIPGSYEFSLQVNDGKLTSAIALTSVLATRNQLPIANAGPDQVGARGVPVMIDGTTSSDPYGQPLDFNWVLSGYYLNPDFGTYQVGKVFSTPIIDFRPDAIGVFTLDLTVTRRVDSAVAKDQMTVTIPGVMLKRTIFTYRISTDYLALPLSSGAVGSVTSNGAISLDSILSFDIISVGGPYTLTNVHASDPSARVTPTWNLVAGPLVNGRILFSSTAPPAGQVVRVYYGFTVQETGETFDFYIDLSAP
jgi:hypothetical protein